MNTPPPDPALDPRGYQPGGISAPAGRFHAIGWARANLFNSWLNALLTLAALWLIWVTCWPRAFDSGPPTRWLALDPAKCALGERDRDPQQPRQLSGG
jgi:hypothetical protein